MGGPVFQGPKRELIRTTVALLEACHLRCPASFPHLEFTEEHLNFGVRIDRRTGGDSYEAQGSAKHDDLILAVSLACWYSEQGADPAPIVTANALPHG